MRWTWLILAGALSGCAGVGAFPMAYTVEDRPQEGRLILTYANETDRSQCLLPEMWPNQKGKIDWGSGFVSLVVEGRTFPIEDNNGGYCPYGCSERIAPGTTNMTFLAYDDFHLPAELREKPKQLNFRPVAFRCPPRLGYRPPHWDAR